MKKKREYRQSITIILFFIATGFILYYPILGNSFLSDDYDSLYRIYIEKRILYQGFLRPMIDISFYFNYLVSGLSPRSFYIFNVAVHIVNALLLFRLASSVEIVDKTDQTRFALAASFLFLIYPFHNESISWLSGRLSSMACFFALLALVLSRQTAGGKFLFLSGLCYILGLLCYESIIILPVIIIVLNLHRYRATKKIMLYSICWTGVTVVYLFTRLLLSGAITGSYGSRIADDNLKQKLLNIPKVLGRLFFPPSPHQVLLTGLTAILFVLLIVMHRWLFKTKSLKDGARFNYLSVLICLAASLLIPVAFGISTRTSESDRLLYFPSCFLCILTASWLFLLCKQSINRWLVLTLSAFYCIWFLEINNYHWWQASRAAQEIMTMAKNKDSTDIVFINMPDEINGAFVFRNGFQKALVINNIDTGRVKVFNYLSGPDYLKTSNTIVPVWKDSVINIFPLTRILAVDHELVHITSGINNKTLTLEKERNSIYYWNKERLIRLFY